jgi:1-acyl-sn-glycerol-3-phosphate acyltransferase
MNIYYGSLKFLFRIFHSILSQDCRVGGEPSVPLGSKIIAANHTIVTDGLFLPFVFRENLYFFIQGYIFDIPLLGWLYRKSEQIPVVPGQKNQSLANAVKLLGEGKVVVIFPEGQLNPNQQPMKARTGTIRLSLMTNTPIIPVGFYVPPNHLRDIHLSNPDHLSHGNWQIGGHCYLQIGTPWLPGEEIGKCVDQNILHGLTDRLMDKIRTLVYAARQVCAKESGLLSNGLTHYGW